jgi:hypothetical protein
VSLLKGKRALYHYIERLVFFTEVTSIDVFQWQYIIQVLRESNLLAACYARFDQADKLHLLPDFAYKHMSAAYVYSQRQTKQVLFESERITTILQNVNITPVFLKGANYTLRNSRNAPGRVYSDIDVLVNKNEIECAEKSLNENGWRSKVMTQYDDQYYRKWSHEIPPMFNVHSGTVIDLHHNIVPPISGRKPELSQLTQHAEVTENGCTVLSIEATILHSAVHLTLNEDVTNGYRDILDISILIKDHHSEKFWSLLLDLSAQTKFSYELFISLQLCEKIAGINVPDYVWEHSIFEPITDIQKWFINHVFYYSVLPHSTFVQSKRHKFAIFCIFIRGHLKKMPLRVLVPHIISKIFLNTRDNVFGKHHFDK